MRTRRDPEQLVARWEATRIKDQPLKYTKVLKIVERADESIGATEVRTILNDGTSVEAANQIMCRLRKWGLLVRVSPGLYVRAK